MNFGEKVDQQVKSKISGLIDQELGQQFESQINRTKVRTTFPRLYKYIKCAEGSNKENNQTNKS